MYNGFWITAAEGNNQFSYQKRKEILGRDPKIWVPPLQTGTLDDLKIGKKIVFEEIDENENLQQCRGLEEFIAFEFTNATGKKIPAVIFDNHNHAFYFWHEAWQKNVFRERSKLIHIDSHKDLRKPAKMLSPTEIKNMESLFRYTNFELNVGNFIVPAVGTGCIDADVVMITTEAACQNCTPENISLRPDQSVIVDIDLDFWAEDISQIPMELSFGIAEKWLQKADFITIATSPYFLRQTDALRTARRVFSSFPVAPK